MSEPDPTLPEMHIGWYLGPSPLPPIDDREREAARRHAADGKVVYGDPNLPAYAPLTMANIVGWREVGPDGTFVGGGEWINEKFEPQPATARCTFHNRLELDVWRVVEGYAPLGALVRALAEVELFLTAAPDQPVESAVTPDEKAIPVLPVYTARQRLPENTSHWSRMTGKEIIERFSSTPQLVIDCNPGGIPGFRLPTRSLAMLWAETQHFASMVQATQHGGLESPQT